jgi:lysophospholipase L1-like esterase
MGSHKVIRYILVLSLAINAAMLTGVSVAIYRWGGFQYLWSLAQRAPYVDLYRINKADIYAATAIAPGARVLLGDTILDMAAAAFPSGTVANRAIAGDKTTDIIDRLPGILKYHPTSIFFMAGINDLQAGVYVDVIERNYLSIVAAVKASSPETKLVCLSLLPVNKKKYANIVIAHNATVHTPKQEDVESMNDFLRNICPRYVKIDALDANGELAADDTLDGLHLDGNGAKALARAIAD